MDNPTRVLNQFQFDITFECQQELPEDLEWKVTYVGSADDQTRDQLLEEVLVGPLQVGVNRFVLTAPPPDFELIANEDLIGVTVLLISCYYSDREFLKIGYYVANEYTEPYDPENPPARFDVNLLRRNILDDQPRVTRIPIDWFMQPNQQDNDFVAFDAEPAVNDEGEVIMDGSDEDMEGDEEEASVDDDNDDDDDMEEMQEDSMDVANMQGQLVRSESS